MGEQGSIVLTQHTQALAVIVYCIHADTNVMYSFSERIGFSHNTNSILSV